MTANNLVSFEALDEIQFRKFVVDELSARLAPITGEMEVDQVRERIMRNAYQQVWEMYNESFTMEDAMPGSQTEFKVKAELRPEANTAFEKQGVHVIPNIKITLSTEPHSYSAERCDIRVTEKIACDEQKPSKKDTTPKKKKKAWSRFVNLFRRIVPSKRK